MIQLMAMIYISPMRYKIRNWAGDLISLLDPNPTNLQSWFYSDSNNNDDIYNKSVPQNHKGPNP